jgi:hypothetical protein
VPRSQGNGVGADDPLIRATTRIMAQQRSASPPLTMTARCGLNRTGIRMIMFLPLQILVDTIIEFT